MQELGELRAEGGDGVQIIYFRPRTVKKRPEQGELSDRKIIIEFKFIA